LRLRRRAAAGGMDRAKVNRFVPGVLIFEMPDSLFVGNAGMQFDLRLLEFQVRARGERKQDRQCEKKKAIFHFGK
jgi:hypothetical protein